MESIDRCQDENQALFKPKRFAEVDLGTDRTIDLTQSCSCVDPADRRRNRRTGLHVALPRRGGKHVQRAAEEGYGIGKRPLHHSRFRARSMSNKQWRLVFGEGMRVVGYVLVQKSLHQNSPHRRTLLRSKMPRLYCLSCESSIKFNFAVTEE